MHVCCVISSLGLGGAERSLLGLCQAWVKRGRRVTLITLSGMDTDCLSIDGRIDRVALGLQGESTSTFATIRSNVRRVWALRRAIVASSPDVVLSFVDVTNVLTLLATRFIRVPVVVAERTFPGAHSIGRIRGGLRRAAYRWARVVVAQTEDGAAWVRDHTGARRTVVIPNFLASEFYSAAVRCERVPLVLAVGRLGREKGFDLLLRAWAEIGSVRRGWRLRIVGEGPEQRSLRVLARELGIEDSVEMAGQLVEIGEQYRAASVFVLPSRYEGFPNVLIEASACGCLCVAFDCRTGPREIFGRLASGTLVGPEDVPGLARAIESLMVADVDSGVRTRLALRTQAEFGIDAGLRRWDGVLSVAVAMRWDAV